MENVCRQKISIIIPAYNERGRLRTTLEHISQIKEKECPYLEVIVVVNGPKTEEDEKIAQYYGARIAKTKRGPSEARNKGAELATGEFLVFLDADTQPSIGTISKIISKLDKNTIATCTAYPNIVNFKSILWSSLKNFLRATGIIKGMSEFLICHKSVVKNRKIYFNPSLNLGEIHDFIYRARRAGVKYKYFRIKRGYRFSVNRLESVGYLKSFLFWLHAWFSTHILKGSSFSFEKKYWGWKKLHSKNKKTT